MSGTSLDGVDVALVSYDHNRILLQDFLTHPLCPALQTALHQLNLSPQVSLQHFCQLEKDVAQAFSQAVQLILQKNHLKANDIDIIGSHGQTIFHAPEIPMSLQIGHAAFIAKHTGIQTAADFRIDDMANGGQGAPLAPAFHQALLGNQAPIALVNIGGIANISFLGKNNHVVGFDTGPGNGLMDEVCQTLLNQSCDFNGDIAAQHSVDPNLLERLMAHPYLKQSAPKSTGRDTFNNSWLKHITQDFPTLSPQKLISTLNQFTVNSILLGLKQLPQKPNALLVCGGGALNTTLINRLQNQLPYPVNTTDSHHINPNALEAMMCAWLGIQRLNNQPIQLTKITGAKIDSILGGLWQP